MRAHVCTSMCYEAVRMLCHTCTHDMYVCVAPVLWPPGSALASRPSYLHFRASVPESLALVVNAAGCCWGLQPPDCVSVARGPASLAVLLCSSPSRPGRLPVALLFPESQCQAARYHGSCNYVGASLPRRKWRLLPATAARLHGAAADWGRSHGPDPESSTLLGPMTTVRPLLYRA